MRREVSPSSQSVLILKSCPAGSQETGSMEIAFLFFCEDMSNENVKIAMSHV